MWYDTIVCSVELLEENILGKQNLSLPADIWIILHLELDTFRQEVSSSCLGNSIPSSGESLTKRKCLEKLKLVVPLAYSLQIGQQVNSYDMHKGPDFSPAA